MSEFCTGNCLGCPNVDKTIEMDVSLDSVKSEIEERACDDALDREIAPAYFEMLQRQGIMVGFPDADRQIESPEELAVIMRMNSAAILEFVADRKESLAESATDLTRNCPGPLKMRAKKAGQIVTATVCMSPMAPQGKAIDMTYVNRQRYR